MGVALPLHRDHSRVDSRRVAHVGRHADEASVMGWQVTLIMHSELLPEMLQLTSCAGSCSETAGEEPISTILLRMDANVSAEPACILTCSFADSVN